MKKLLLVLLLTALSSSLFAQKINVTESNEHIAGGTNNALVVTIYEASADAIEKDVKSLLKEYNAKVTSQDGACLGNNAVIKKMGKNPVDIYVKWEKVNDGETRLCMAFDMGSAFVSSSTSPAEYDAAKEIVQKLAAKTTGDAMQIRVKAEQKTFDRLNDDQKKLEKENKSLNDDIVNYNQRIEDCKQKIKKAQADIETNKSNQGEKKSEISAQQKMLDAVKDKQKSLN